MSLADHEKRRQPQIYPQQYTYETYKTRGGLTRCFRDLFRDFCGCVLKASGRGDKWTTEHFTESMDDQQYFDQIVQMIDQAANLTAHGQVIIDELDYWKGLAQSHNQRYQSSQNYGKELGATLD